MSDVTRHHGKVGPHKESHEPRLLATNFLKSGVFLNEEPVVITTGLCVSDATHGITQWGMDNNDTVGCCGFAADDHSNIAKTGNAALAGTFGSPKFATLLDAYYAYGIAQGEPPPTPDQGVDNASMFAWLYEQDLIYGYGEVPLDSLDYFVNLANGVIAGVVIDGDQASQDFDQGIAWGAFPGAQDGHDVLIAKTDGQGAGTLVTWGGLQVFTPEFRGQIQDAWVIFDADDPTIDHAALISALNEVHGTVVPTSTQTSKGVWDQAVSEIERLRSWTNDRSELHKLAMAAIENESINLLTNELGTLLKLLKV